MLASAQRKRQHTVTSLETPITFNHHFHVFVSLKMQYGLLYQMAVINTLSFSNKESGQSSLTGSGHFSMWSSMFFCPFVLQWSIECISKLRNAFGHVLICNCNPRSILDSLSLCLKKLLTFMQNSN